MTGTDITNLLEIIQRKIDAADGNTATKDLLYLLSAVRKGDGTALELYDSSGAFPDLTDSDADKEMIAYKLDSDRLYFNVGVWKGKSLPAGGGGGAGTQAQGSNFGYASGGFDGSSITNIIDKFPFAADANATDVGDLTVGRYYVAGQSSSVSGYTSGGSPTSNVIDKFLFSVDGNASDVGDLTASRARPAGQSSIDNGYSSGGIGYNVIDKFPFATDANATDVGDLTTSQRYSSAGQSSTTHGYISGGFDPSFPTPGVTNAIEKFTFATDANATDVGDLSVGRQVVAGQSSADNGYTSGGSPSGTVIDKFPFASDTNATDVGDLLGAFSSGTGQSSIDNGYFSGGAAPIGYLNIIQKFPFSSDGNATDVGDLTSIRINPAGQQY
jgi:hypothetical protein